MSVLLQERSTALPVNLAASQRRSFLTALQNASGLLSSVVSSTKPLHFHASRVLPYSKSSLYDIVSDIQAYPQFLPAVLDAKILAQTQRTSTHSKSLPALASLEVGLRKQDVPASFAGLNQYKAVFVSNVYCSPEKGMVEAVAGIERQSTALNRAELVAHGYDERPVQNTSTVQDAGPGIFKVCRTLWQLEELGQNKTEVNLSIDIDWKNVFLAGMTKAAAPTMAESMIQAFERRAATIARS